MDDDRLQLICFEICGEKFAFNMECLVEIVQTQLSDITPFFSSMPIIRGKWDYRGSSLYVIDLRDFFGLEEKKRGGKGTQPLLQTKRGSQVFFENRYGQKTDSPEEFDKKNSSKCMLVVKIHERMFGLFSDTVLQVLPLVDFYEYPNMLSTVPGRYFMGITTIDAELVILLAIQEFVKDYEFDALLDQDRDSEEPASSDVVQDRHQVTD